MREKRIYILSCVLFILTPVLASASVLYSNIDFTPVVSSIPGAYHRPTQWTVEGGTTTDGTTILGAVLWASLSPDAFGLGGSADIWLNGSKFSHTVVASDFDIAQPLKFTGSFTTNGSDFHIDTYTAGGFGNWNNPSRVYGSVSDTYKGAASYAKSSNGVASVDVDDLWFQVCTDSACAPYVLATSTITASTTWLRNQVYKVSGTVTVSSGAQLTIQPGAVVKFDTATSSLLIDGSLTVDGTSDTPVYFTSLKDDTAGGDTNVDGASTTPSVGDWNGLKIGSGASSTIRHAVIRYGGYMGSGGSSKLIWNNGGFLKLRNSEVATGTQYGVFTDGSGAETTITESNIHHFYGTPSNNAVEVDAGILHVAGSDISHATSGITVMGGTATVDSSDIFSNSSYGVYQEGGISTVQASTVYYNNYGIYLNGGTNMFVHSNYIYGNTTDGVYNNKANHDLNGQYNYWGATNGPSGDGSGSGQSIHSRFGSSIIYNPYLTSVHYVNVTSGGATTSAVHSRTIKYVATSTQYTSEWYQAVDTWNALNAVAISTSTSASTSDLWVFDIDDSSVTWIAGYSNDHTGSSTLNDQIRFNSYYMPSVTSKLMVATHELGHALGLGHSYQGNVMFCCDNPLYATTTLGTRDISDYNWLWP